MKLKARGRIRLLSLIISLLLMTGLFGCSKTKVLPLDLVPETTQEETILIENNPIEKNVDFSEVFDGINGCAVIFAPHENTYYFYHQELALIQASPCSTFKIISTLMGLNNGIVSSEQGKMAYSGAQYPIKAWNRDLTLREAFQTSCVWYFRQMIDQVGENAVLGELEELNYGNGDIGEWNGSNINSMADLNGFWLESSLKISPLEQTKVLYNIFEGNTEYQEADIQILKNMMRIEIEGSSEVYGKTGTGINGHAWFVGFSERGIERQYFAVYLDDATAANVNSSRAKEIALRILEDL